MTITIDLPIYLILFIFLIAFLPHLHLLFLFSIVGIAEWFNKLIELIFSLCLNIIDIVIHIISNPIILTGLLIYLCMSITRFTAI